jgi:site-specific recombinase XerD
MLKGGIRFKKLDHPKRAYSEIELMKLLPACHEHDLRLAGMVEIAFATGHRVTAIAKLWVENVRFEMIGSQEFAVVTFPEEKGGKQNDESVLAPTAT